jgi:hypothetical protein
VTTTTDAGAEVITILDRLGFSNYIIPFLMIWTAMYAVTMKLKIPSDDPKLNGLLAFAMAYLFVSFGGGYMLNALLPFFMITFLLIFIALLLFLFIGVEPQKIVSVITRPISAVVIIGFLVLFVFVALQDWLVMSDRIPAWQVNESGDLIVEERLGTEYPGNITDVEGKPHSIIVDGDEYVLIEGIYYKQGYEGAAYAIGQPQVIAGIMMLMILGITTALIVWPKS